MFDTLEKKVINPLIEAAGFSDGDAKVFKRELARVITAEIIIKALKELPEEESQAVSEKVNQQIKVEDKLTIIREAVKNSKKAQEAIGNYLKKDLPHFIEELISRFIGKATSSQRKKLFNLLAVK